MASIAVDKVVVVGIQVEDSPVEEEHTVVDRTLEVVVRIAGGTVEGIELLFLDKVLALDIQV
jgi:hypothetical protein